MQAGTERFRGCTMATTASKVNEVVQFALALKTLIPRDRLVFRCTKQFLRVSLELWIAAQVEG